MEFTPLKEEHLPQLRDTQAEYVSDTYVRAVHARGEGFVTIIRLWAEELEEPFLSQGLSIIRERDGDGIRARMGQQALQLVVHEDGRLIAFLDAEAASWRRVLKVWNLLVNEQYRRRGIGTKLIHRATEFATTNNCRAISVEAQATNWPALCFYTRMGFEICGVDDHFYTNRDLEGNEVALFLYREL